MGCVDGVLGVLDMPPRLVEAACHRKHGSQAAPDPGVEHRQVVARSAELLQTVDRLGDRGRVLAEPAGDRPDNVVPHHLVTRGGRVLERPLERRERLLRSTPAVECLAEQVLGRREAARVVELLERSDRVPGERNEIRRVGSGIVTQPLPEM